MLRPLVSVNQVKIQNRKRVFERIIAGEAVTRLEIAADTGLSPATVSSIVDEISKKGIIREMKDDKSTVGRKPSLLQFIPGARKVLSIDLCSKNFAYTIKDLGLATKSAFWYEYKSHLAYADNIAIFCKQIRDAIHEENITDELIGVGVVVPGPYNQAEDRVVNKLIPELSGIQLHALLSEYLSPYPVIIDHDVKLAAKAEVDRVAEYKMKSVFFMYIGEGVGGAISIDGQIYGGADEFAGDVGQMMIDDEKNIEQLTSWTRFVHHLANGYGLQAHEVTTSFIAQKYQENDALLWNELRRVADVIGVAMTNIVWMYNPHLVIIGGPYTMFGSPFVEQITKPLRERLMPELFERLTLLLSGYEEKSSLVGAAGVVRENWIDSWHG